MASSRFIARVGYKFGLVLTSELNPLQWCYDPAFMEDQQLAANDLHVPGRVGGLVLQQNGGCRC